MIFKRDLFILSLSPLVSWLFLVGAKWYIGPPKNRKKCPRKVRREYAHHVFRENRRHRRNHRKIRPPRMGRQVPFRFRRQVIYAPRILAPTVLEQNALRILRDIRFELVRSRNSTSERTHMQQSRAGRNRHSRSRRNRGHLSSSRNQAPTVLFTTGNEETSADEP